MHFCIVLSLLLHGLSDKHSESTRQAFSPATVVPQLDTLRYLLLDETIRFNLSIQISNALCLPTRHSTQCPLQSPKWTSCRVICSSDRQITRCDVPQEAQIAAPVEYRVGTGR